MPRVFSISTPSDDAPRWQLLALLLVLAIVLLAAFPYFEQIRNANELPRLVQGMSLVEQGEWAIDGPSRRGLAIGPDVARSPKDGRMYPNKPPGASVVAGLGFVLARAQALGDPPTLRAFTWWARLLAGTIPLLIIAALAWGQLRSAYGGPISAAAIVLIVFGTPLFSYGRLVYGHSLAACLLFAGVLAIERGTGEQRAWRVALGGMLAAAAITVEYGAAFAGLPIAVALLWPVLGKGRSAPTTASDRKAALVRALAGLGGALVPVAMLAAYQRAVYGSFTATGYHHAADPGFAKLHGQGLLGLGAPTWENVRIHLFAPSTGLLVWSPLVVVACIGLLRALRHEGELRRIARLQAAIFAVILLMGLGLSFQGGWRIGPRYIVVALPMLTLGLAEALKWYRAHPRVAVGAAGMGLIALAAMWSLTANSFAATLWPHIDPTNIAEPFGAVLLPLWEHGYGPYGLPAWFAAGLILCLVAPVLIGVAALIWAAGLVRPQQVLLPTMLGLVFGAVIVLVVLPLTVVAHPKTEANLRYIERVYEPRIRDGRRVPGPSVVLEPLSDAP